MGISTALLIALAGCPSSDHIQTGDQSRKSVAACRSACLPYAWSLKLETSRSREDGCTCSGPALEVAR